MSQYFNDPHASTPLLAAGPEPEAARATLILLHGRGASAEDILGIHEAIGLDDVAALAPQAAGNTWYPNSFLARIESNQPFLDSALRRISATVDELLGRGIGSERIALLGFSQGGCLTCEFLARNPRRYGGAMALTGGVQGPLGLKREFEGDLAGTPVFLGANDPDPHVPFRRVEETRDIFVAMGAQVELRRYPGLPHSVNDDEIQACRELLKRIV